MAGPIADPRDQPPEALLQSSRGLGVEDLAVRRLLSAVIGRGIHDPAEWGARYQVPRRLTDQWPPLPRLALERSLTSTVDGFQKLLFRTSDGLKVETVLIPL